MLRAFTFSFVWLILASSSCGQLGVSQVVTFTNKMIPHLLQGLSYTNENVVYSPFGVASALAMVMDGVGVRMASEITRTLGLGGPNVRQLIRQGVQALLEYLQKHGTGDDRIGSYNRAFVHSSMPLIPEYQELLENYYKATVTSNITEGVAELILDLQTDTGVMSHWKDYDKLAVYTYLSHQPAAPFMTANGSIVQVPMIPQIGTFRAGYLPKLNSQAVELPLSDEHSALILIMPDYREGISDTIKMLVNENIASLSASLPPTEAEVTLPQFAIVSSDLDIGEVVKKSGDDVGEGEDLNVCHSCSLNESPGFKEKSWLPGTGRRALIPLPQCYSRLNPPYEMINNLTPVVHWWPQRWTSDGRHQRLDFIFTSKSTKGLKGPVRSMKQNGFFSTSFIAVNSVATSRSTLYKNLESKVRKKRDAVAAAFVFNKPFIYLLTHKPSGVTLLAGIVKTPTQVPS